MRVDGLCLQSRRQQGPMVAVGQAHSRLVLIFYLVLKSLKRMMSHRLLQVRPVPVGADALRDAKVSRRNEHARAATRAVGGRQA